MMWRRQSTDGIQQLPAERKALAERYTIDAEEAQRREQLAAATAEREAEEQARRDAEAELERKAAEEEARRAAEAEEQARRVAEEEARRAAEAEEQARRAAEAERERKALEEQAQRAAEEEAGRARHRVLVTRPDPPGRRRPHRLWMPCICPRLLTISAPARNSSPDQGLV